ncbi:MAG: methylated-DNA--[protein]-cysteine S-methyltransferase [Acidimicrobiales bacterium]
MAAVSYCTFETAIGDCAIAWTDNAIVGLQLPEETPRATERRLKRRYASASAANPRGVVGDAIDRVVSLLAGQPADLDVIPIDISAASPFHQAVWETTRRIGRGDVVTYGEVARRVGDPGAAQAVGQALGANPIAIIIPCHRVVGANQSLVGFSANGGVETKRRMLLIEGSTAVAPSLFDLIE